MKEKENKKKKPEKTPQEAIGQDARFTIKSRFTPQVFREFSFFNTFVLGARWLTVLIFPVVVLGTATVLFLQKNERASVVALVLVLLCIAFAGGYIILYQRGLGTQIQKFGLKKDNPPVRYTLYLDDGGVSITNGKERTRVLWGEFFGVYVYKKNFYLYYNRSRSFLMPFADIEGGTPEEVWAFFKQKMAPEKCCSKNRLFR